MAELLRRRVRDVPDYPSPGILFRDIGPLLADAQAFSAALNALVAEARDADLGITKVAGIEARGFVLAAPVAHALHAGFVPVRKAGKLPGRTLRTSYALEYGEATLELQQDAVVAGDRVLLVDDVLATGGTAEAATALLREARADVVGLSVLIELLALGGRQRLGSLRLRALLRL